MKLSDFFAQKELAHEQRLKEQREQHKCNTCVYAQWIGIGKVYCMFPNCIKEDDTTQK